MDRDDTIGLVQAGLVAFLAYMLFAIFLLALATYAPGFFLLVIGFSVAAAAVLLGLFLPKFSLATSTADAGRVLSHIAYQFRRRELRVEETSDSATIRLGSTVALRVHVRRSLTGSRIAWQAYATPAGWGTLATLIVLVWGAPASLGVILYVFRKGRRFARDVVIPLVRESESAALPREDEVRTMLISGLSEGHRLASESYEALRSSYTDSVAIVGVTAGLVWSTVFVVLLLTPPLAGDWMGAAGVGIVAGVLTGLGLYIELRRRTARRLHTLRAWSVRLREALSRETTQAELAAPELSSVELLLEASRQIPTWLQARRRVGLSADQVADWIVFILSLAAFWTGWTAVAQLFTPAPPFLIVILEFAATVILAVAAYLIWGRWKKKRDEALARTQAEWGRRINALQAKLDGFFEEL